MFIIKWRNRQHRRYDRITFTGLSRYPSMDAAERQVERFKRIGRDNVYFIERA